MLRRFFGSKKHETQTSLDTLDEVARDFYVDPESSKVDGPGKAGGFEGNWKFEKKEVIYSSGPNGYAIATGTLSSDSFQGERKVLALRWNGAENNESDKGYPKVGTNAQWYPVPSEFAGPILSRLREITELETLFLPNSKLPN